MKKIGFGLVMLLGGCVSDTAATGLNYTPISAMPTGTATYNGRVSQALKVSDQTVGTNRFTNMDETISADFTLVANFKNRTATGTATNATFESTYLVDRVGGSNPVTVVDKATFSGSATGVGAIGTDATGIFFNSNLIGTFTAVSATRNDTVTPVSNVLKNATLDLDVVASGYFTGANATGFFGQETINYGGTFVPEGSVTSVTNTVSGAKR